MVPPSLTRPSAHQANGRRRRRRPPPEKPRPCPSTSSIRTQKNLIPDRDEVFLAVPPWLMLPHGASTLGALTRATPSRITPATPRVHPGRSGVSSRRWLHRAFTYPRLSGQRRRLYCSPSPRSHLRLSGHSKSIRRPPKTSNAAKRDEKLTSFRHNIEAERCGKERSQSGGGPPARACCRGRRWNRCPPANADRRFTGGQPAAIRVPSLGSRRWSGRCS